jgi:hypothetical protein
MQGLIELCGTQTSQQFNKTLSPALTTRNDFSSSTDGEWFCEQLENIQGPGLKEGGNAE